jgi:hypothetical protein
LTRTYRRAASCLLDASHENNLPRTGLVHVGETHWLSWEALDRAIRRDHGGKVGRLRVCRSDGTVLIVCAEPFRGSRPLSPAEVLDVVSTTIDQLNTRRHAFRLLGKWSDRLPKSWKQIARYKQPLSLITVREELEKLGQRAKLFHSQALSGLIWRADSEATMEGLLKACPSLAKGENKGENTNPSWTNSDTPSPEDDPSEWEPFTDGG